MPTTKKDKTEILNDALIAINAIALANARGIPDIKPGDSMLIVDNDNMISSHITWDKEENEISIRIFKSNQEGENETQIAFSMNEAGVITPGDGCDNLDDTEILTTAGNYLEQAIED